MFVSCIISFFSMYQEARHLSNQQSIVLLLCLIGVAESRTVQTQNVSNLVLYSNNLPSSRETYLSTEPNMPLIKMSDQIWLNEHKFGIHSNTTARPLIGPECCCFTLVQAPC